MLIKVGEIEAIFRYPVKSMACEVLDHAELGWHGIEGDRRFAFHRVEDRGGFPFLTAAKMPELLRYIPVRRDASASAAEPPIRIRTPDSSELDVFGEALAAEVSLRHGAPVQMMQLDRGIFDEASVSLISSDTVDEVARLAEQPADVRRFRPNLVARLLRPVPFQEDEWIGGTLAFGEGADAAAIAVTLLDVRCAMVNLDPESAVSTPEVLKAIVRMHEKTAGVYSTVTRRGRIEVGQPIFFRGADQ